VTNWERSTALLGTTRFVLALIIASFHAGWRPWGIAWGQPAAMAFLMISGHGVTALGERYFSPAVRDTRAFWLDRFLRIYPAYLFWMCATAFVVLVLHRHWLFHQGKPDWVSVLCNLTVFPLSFYMYIPSLAALFILPQTWSLSIEAFFYALFPAIARWRGLDWALALGGLAVFGVASVGWLEPEYYTYRLLPGALPYLMLGRAVWRGDRLLQGAILAGFHAILGVVWLTGDLDLGMNRDLLLGVLPAYLVLLAAAHVRPSAWDRALGNATYGIYLSQMFVLAALSTSVQALPWRVAIVSGGAAILGAASFRAIEVPVNRLRRRLRKALPAP
jgi:peptidoglycan/LPS O-acetylase OafA/YrhL